VAESTDLEPLVSILTPTLNAETYIETCLKSVLAQTYPNIEHVIADGGSTDGTLAIIERYAKALPGRIRVTSAKDNGVGSALKRGFAHCHGDVIGWIDADDIYEPGAVKTAIDYFAKHDDAQFIYGGCRIIDANGDHIGSFVIRDFDRKQWLNEWHYIVFCATFFKRDVIEKVGFVNDLGNDLYFYLKVSRRFRLDRLDETLTNWRLHEGSISLKPAPREAQIRRNRAREDFFLVLKHGGSIFSPRALVYYTVIEPSIARSLGRIFGGLRPITQKWSMELHTSTNVVRKKAGSYALPLLGGLARSTAVGWWEIVARVWWVCHDAAVAPGRAVFRLFRRK
jgi:glycosyltransferase involved in cell wall biosynthesis